MKIVGVGCGPKMLTEEAIVAIRSAHRIFGSRRAIELAREHLPSNADVQEIHDFHALADIPEDAVILSTGDPMLSGLGSLSGEVIPGISSLQVAVARIRIPLERICAVTAHGCDHVGAIQEAVEEIIRGRAVFITAEPAFSLETLAAALRKVNPELKIAIFEDLGYPTERIAVGTADAPPVVRSRLFSLLAGDF
ncbi:MAG: cobalt-precorrin-7 (C(5))-methyltransferase [Methanomicrobiales archaeon]|nr:cobalt-precorrin-7 (C(5))-methyltransferase [Methanomicrobiales archaeon]